MVEVCRQSWTKNIAPFPIAATKWSCFFLSLSRVFKIDLSYLDLTQESNEDIARIFRRFRKISMRYCHVSKDQLLVAIQTLHTLTGLESLSLDSLSLTLVPGHYLSQAVTRVQDLSLSNTGLTHSQLGHILVQLPISRVQSLSLSGQDLSSLEPGLLCLPCDKVTRLDLANTSLTETQLSALLTAIIWSNSIEVKMIS